MAEDRPDPAPRPDAEGRRSTQTIAPVDRARGRRPAGDQRAAEQDPVRPVSTARGDIPAALRRRYFTEDGRLATVYFAGPGAKTAAFRDHGDKLSTRQVDPNTIRDMAAIAAHRGWRAIQVRGDDDFRREVWMQARALGLEVRGYRPSQRDNQELEAQLAGHAGRTRSPAGPPLRPGRSAQAERGPAPSGRPDFVRGVRGVLLESGQAPYRHRQGQPVTPYVRLDRGDGRGLDIWGVGLPEALARSGAKPGDQVLVRRDGVDRVRKTIEVRDPRTGDRSPKQREVPRNRWTILAERFRHATAAQAARDPELRAAQSQLAVLKTVIQSTLRDPASQARAYAAAREQIAERLGQGRQFRTARVQEQMQTAERAEPPPNRRTGRSVADPEQGPERTRRR